MKKKYHESMVLHHCALEPLSFLLLSRWFCSNLLRLKPLWVYLSNDVSQLWATLYKLTEEDHRVSHVIEFPLHPSVTHEFLDLVYQSGVVPRFGVVQVL